MRKLWNVEWWSIAFGGPIGNVLNAWIADVPWISPNRLTLLSFACKLAAIPLLLLGTRNAELTVIALLQAHTVLDCMDGSLARYRGRSSVLGAYLDKVTDMVGLVGIMAALGWRAAQQTGDALVLLVAMLIAAALQLRFYVYWVVMHLEREALVARPTVGDVRRDASTLTVGQRAKLYLQSMPKIVLVSESDLYFWFALGLALECSAAMIYAVGIAQAIWLVLVLGKRTRDVYRLDRGTRR